MGKGRKPKCRYCGEEIIDKTYATKKGNYWYHNDCLKQKEAEKEANKTDKEKLMDYISTLYDGNIPTYVHIQLAKFRKDYDMKDLGMLLCLKYCFEDLGLNFDDSKGVGIIPYYYTQCKNNWIKEQEIKEAVENFEFDDKEVVVNKRFDNRNRCKYKPIDMEDL